MFTLLLTAPYMIPVLDRFKPVFAEAGISLIVPEVQERMEEQELLKYAGQFDCAICGDDRFTARVLQACAPRLKIISKWGTGIDSIDSEAASSLGIKVARTQNAFTTPVADTIMGYILAFARRQPWMDKEMKAGMWRKLSSLALCECTLGVIGVGNIGKAVTRRARAFGMQVLGNDIIEIDHVFINESGIKMTGLPYLLTNSDFIAVTCDLNLSSHYLVNKQTLAEMKPEAILINTSRGPIVDEKALIDALQSGRIAGAALDVFEFEPLPKDSPLLKMENVLLAPHNSNSSPAAWERVHWNTIKNLFDGLGIVFSIPDSTNATVNT